MSNTNSITLLGPVAKLLYDKIVEDYKARTSRRFPKNPKFADFYDSYNTETIGHHIVDSVGHGEKKAPYYLYKGIRDKAEKIDLKEKDINTFLEYLGEDSMQDFIQKYEATLEPTIYKEQEKLLDNNRITNPYEREQLFFDFYIWKENSGVIPYILAIDDELKKAELYRNEEEYYCGDVEQKGNIFSFNLRQKQIYENHHQRFMFQIFNNSHERVEQTPFLLGTYTATTYGQCSAGKVLLQRITKEQIKERTKKEICNTIRDISVPLAKGIDERIIGELLYQNVEPPRQTFESLEDMPSYLYGDIKRFIGVYKSYIVTTTESVLKISAIEIRPDLSTRCVSDNGLMFEGHTEIVFASGRFLWLTFKRKQARDHEKFNIILNANQPINSEVDMLFGAYHGLSYKGKIMGGREVFIRQPTEKKFEDVDIRSIPLGSEEYDKIMKANPEFPAFFAGKDQYRQMFDDVPFLEKLNRKFSLPKKTEFHTNRLKNLEGVYHNYYFGSRGNIRHSYMNLVVRPDGDGFDGYVEGKSMRRSILKGRFKLYLNALHIEISVYDGVEEYSRVNVLFHSRRSSDFKRLVGVFNCISDKGTPMTSKEVLIKADGVDFNTVQAGLIKINSEEFHQLNKEQDGLGNFLVGLNSQIVLKDEVNIKRFEQDQKYGVLYFNSACYKALSYKKEDSEIEIDDILEELKLAFINGFKDKKLLQAEINDGTLVEVKDRIDVDELRVKASAKL